MRNADGVVVDAANTDGQAGVQASGNGRAEVIVLPARGTFPAGVQIEAGDARALAVELLRIAGDLQPAAYGSGDQLFLHTCSNVEWWDEARQGPINEQGCDACESAPYPDGWRPVYVLRDRAPERGIAADSDNLLRAQLAGALSQRDQLLVLLREVLAHFHERGHPGRPCKRTGWVSEEQISQWWAEVERLTPPPSRPPG